MVCFAANIDLGWIALCKAGDWSDPESCVIAVDDAIKKGVFPAISAGSGSVLFRVGQGCTTPPPPRVSGVVRPNLRRPSWRKTKRHFFMLTMAVLDMLCFLWLMLSMAILVVLTMAMLAMAILTMTMPWL